MRRSQFPPPEAGEFFDMNVSGSSTEGNPPRQATSANATSHSVPIVPANTGKLQHPSQGSMPTATLEECHKVSAYPYTIFCILTVSVGYHILSEPVHKAS